VSSPSCHCGSGLSIDYRGKDETWICHCPRCRARAERNGEAIDVDGYGKTLLEAVKNWNERVETF
jgi:hypothetical protein